MKPRIAMPASFCLISPNSAIARPNWRRSFAYVTACASARLPADRLRLGQAVGADQLAAGEPRQVARLLLLGAEVHERQRADRRVRTDRSAERRVHRDLLADVRGADQIEAEAAVALGDLEPQQIE